MGGACGAYGEDRGLHRMVGKPEGKMPLGRPRRGWENNIKMDLQEVAGGRGDWVVNFLTSGKVYWLASQDGLCSME